MTNKPLFLVAILLLLVAPTIAHAQTSTNTTASGTNQLLKQILDQQKLQTELQQDNANVMGIKLDIIKVGLERILVQLEAPPTIPPPPPFSQPQLPPINPGCGIGSSLCNIPVPPPSSSSLNATLNGTICKEHNDNGVIIQCPVFPGLESQPPFPVPLPPGAIPCGNSPCSPFVPPFQQQQQQCGFILWGVFC